MLINKPHSEGNTYLHTAIKNQAYIIIEVSAAEGKMHKISQMTRANTLFTWQPLISRELVRPVQLFKRVLEESGEIINSVTKNGETPLHYAVRSGNLEAVRALLVKNGQLFKRNTNELNCLQIAAVEGSGEILKEILMKFKKGKNQNESPCSKKPNAIASGE